MNIKGKKVTFKMIIFKVLQFLAMVGFPAMLVLTRSGSKADIGLAGGLLIAVGIIVTIIWTYKILGMLENKVVTNIGQFLVTAGLMGATIMILDKAISSIDAIKGLIGYSIIGFAIGFYFKYLYDAEVQSIQEKAVKDERDKLATAVADKLK